jgi:hypothetical protein
MSLQTPALTGGGSAVGFAREDTWGTPSTSAAADPNKLFGSVSHPAHFMSIKEETFEPKVDAQPQLDDLDQNREISRVISNGNTIDGAVRCNIGPESIGWFLTMLFGSPQTSSVNSSSASDGPVYQHIWIPGMSPAGAAGGQARADWPAPFSFESRLDTEKSKLIMGALCRRLGLEVPNNGAAMLSADFIAKSMQIIQGAGTSAVVDASGDAKPCILTASPTFIDETEWHWKQLKAASQKLSNSADVLAAAYSITSMSFDWAFPDLHGIFTGGSGQDIGTYGVDKFQASGRVTMLFEDETYFYKIKDGTYFASEVMFEGAAMEGTDKSSLKIETFSTLAAQPGLPNKVGDLQYDFAWNARKDPTLGYSTKITLVNTTAVYTA